MTITVHDSTSLAWLHSQPLPNGDKHHRDPGWPPVERPPAQLPAASRTPRGSGHRHRHHNRRTNSTPIPGPVRELSRG